MTAIAYKNGVLAADSLIQSGELTFALKDKVRVVNTAKGLWLIAEAGNCGDSMVIADEVEDFITQDAAQGGRGECLTEEEFVHRASRQFHTLKTTGHCSVLVVRPSGGTSTFNKDGFDGHWAKDVTVAIGTPQEFLQGAMSAGATAERAVELSVGRYGCCANPVKTYIAGGGHVPSL